MCENEYSHIYLKDKRKVDVRKSSGLDKESKLEKI